MTGVTWGPTTVLGKGSVAPATPSLFGTTPSTPSTAPSPNAGAFNFSSNPPVQSPSTPTTSSLFSAATNAYGSAASLFGNTSASLNPNPTANAAGGANSSALEAPQQAAIQAHMNATLHQEASRLEFKLSNLYSAYTPYTAAPAPAPPPAAAAFSFASAAPPPAPPPAAALPPNPSCRFQFIFYDLMSPAQRLEKSALSSSSNYPPRPPHIDHGVWTRALAQSPDPEQYMPVVVTSAEGLHSRLVAQQSSVDQHAAYLRALDDTVDKLRTAIVASRIRMKNYDYRNVMIRQRLLALLRKLELCRGKNLVLQPSERAALEQVVLMLGKVHELGKVMEALKRDGEQYVRHLQLVQQQRRLLGEYAGGGQNTGLDQDLKVKVDAILMGQRDGMEKLNNILKKDERDLEIVKQRALQLTTSSNVNASVQSNQGVSALPMNRGGFGI